MASKIISNISAEVKFPTGRMNVCVSFETEDARYHLWLDEQNSNDGTLYKNPLRSVNASEPGYFNTRHLDAFSKGNAPMVAEALAAVDLKQARAVYAAAKHAEEMEKAATAGKVAFEQGQPIEAGDAAFYARNDDTLAAWRNAWKDAEAAAQVEAARQRRAAQADRALELLHRYMDICGNEGKPLFDADIIHLPELWQEANQVLIAAGI